MVTLADTRAEPEAMVIEFAHATPTCLAVARAEGLDRLTGLTEMGSWHFYVCLLRFEVLKFVPDRVCPLLLLLVFLILW